MEHILQYILYIIICNWVKGSCLWSMLLAVGVSRGISPAGSQAQNWRSKNEQNRSNHW